MSKLIVDYPNNEVLVHHVHALQFIDLYAEYIYPKVIQDADNTTPENDPFGLGRATSLWGAEQVLRVGLITLYHHWERSLNELLAAQAQRARSKLPSMNKKSMVAWSRETLLRQFEAELPEQIWSGMEELRRLVNALKHADLDSYESLSRDYPEYFRLPTTKSITATDYENCFLVAKAQYDRLATSVSSFWDKLPYTLAHRGA